MHTPISNAMSFSNSIRLILFFALFLTAAHGADKDDASRYILRPNDSISLSVYQEPDLSGKVRILKTGEASFPLLGPV